MAEFPAIAKGTVITGVVTGDGSVVSALGFTPENAANKGAASGYCELDSSSKVPTSRLPSYVSSISEVANYAALPGTGSTGVIYITLDDNKTFRWGGTVYVEISPSLALGETSTTAYRGDRGKTAYDHTSLTNNPHSVTASQVGAVATNTAITASTKTKITYDAKGLITSGADATTADIADSTDKRYVTDAQKTILGNTSGTNTGDETASGIRSKLGITTLSGSNTGDETTATIKTKLGAATASTDGYMTAAQVTTLTTHGHGGISNTGAIGTLSGKPIITGTSGVLQVGAFGTTTGTFATGDHTHSTYALTTHTHSTYALLAHMHGEITTAGAVGITADLPLITGSGGLVQAGAFAGNGSAITFSRSDHYHPGTTWDVIVVDSATTSTVDVAGKVNVIVEKLDTGEGTVTISDSTTGYTINRQSTYVLSVGGESVLLMRSGSNWQTIKQ